jgi:hypothetical protein
MSLTFVINPPLILREKALSNQAPSTKDLSYLIPNHLIS